MPELCAAASLDGGGTIDKEEMSTAYGTAATELFTDMAGRHDEEVSAIFRLILRC